MRIAAVFYRISKLSEAPDSKQPARKANGFAPGPGQTLPVGYEVVGLLLEPIAIGAPIVLLRLVRNGIVRPGLFTSSEVKEIRLVTQNSIYRVEVLPGAIPSTSFRTGQP